MFDAVLVLGDCVYWAGLLAGDRDIDYSVVRTALVADAAADTFVMIDVSFAGMLVKAYGTFRTVVDAASGHASPAKVCDIVFDLHTRGASLVDHTHYILLDIFLSGTLGILTGKRDPRIFRQRGEFISLVTHVKTEQRKGFVFPHRSLLMYAATSWMLGVTRTQLNRQSVDLLHQHSIFPKLHKLCEKTVTHYHDIVFVGHYL